MRLQPKTLGDWQGRSRQNLRAAVLLVARHPPLVMPAISRLYYAAFHAALAALHRAGTRTRDHHGDVWSAAEALRPGLGKELWGLYKWRMRADYATGLITLGEARNLVAQYTTTCATLGIVPEGP
jgi:uncharacterized protein (UPF0332 family)